ncbi:aminopeptidase [Planococcus sp. SE5232]|uniref:aminopeptidase n=1 Tax=unclassified Planococcus (in: firmicutes) TaxID=2662419 RepID=UPI003D6BB5C0
MSDFNQVVSALMKKNFSLDKSSTVLVLTDISTKSLGSKFTNALAADEWKVDMHVMEDRAKSGEEPSKEAAELMENYEIVFCLTKYSLTHTVARKDANAKGISVITMPGITEDMFLNGAMTADYDQVEKETIEMTEKLTRAKSVVIRTGKGLELKIEIDGRNGVPSTGIFRTKGASGNLPSGEAYIAPVEGESEGQIEINGSIAGIGLLENPVMLAISQGRVVEASGSEGLRLLEMLGENDGRFLCELGIGTNYAARVTGNILEDEKAYNTIHVAFGSNHTFGGAIKTNVHIDCVTKKPKIEWVY